VPISVEQIVEETRTWPTKKVEELLDRLTQELHTTDADNETAWKNEARRRLAEIENGSSHPVDGDIVAARIRKIVER
jgi:hypothetical protein